MESMMLLALSDAVWMAIIVAAGAAVTAITSAAVTIFTAYFQSRSLNESSQVRSDAVGKKVDDQTVRIEDHVDKVVEASNLYPKKVEVVNTEPVPVVETIPGKHLPRKK